MEWVKRTKLLFGDEVIQKFYRSHVLVVGLGGVGAYAAEQIVRAGIGKLTIVDADTVEPSNINRQMPALHSTLGQFKAQIMKQRLTDINPDLQLTVLNQFLVEESIPQVLKEPYNYVIDAIDTLSPKVQLIRYSLERQIPIVSSMGSGGKTDPTQVSIVDISKTYNCMLARKVRKRLSKFNIRKGVTAVFSPEEISKEMVVLEEGRYKASNVGTISYMPAVFGCFCASVVINDLRKD
ncbi:MAG: tRNA threonylcarbamoyladenosine dehydratase [Salinivirgaceae bacterium]|jgi:tRNA A37 threonylcarbamoyladenosine dehydratase|nr:tRNA threonylcarbamoyladenosine dehydratase [Salinivirgaceae bacterium]